MLSGITSTIGIVGGLFGGDDKDPLRFAQVDQHFDAARNGDTTALAWLYAHATGTDANHDPVFGYFATTSARQYAQQKYNEVVAGQKVGDIAAKVSSVASTISQAAGTVAGQAAAAAVQADPTRNPASGDKTLLFAAVIVVSLFLWFRRDAK